jgi:hypothetical protein
MKTRENKTYPKMKALIVLVGFIAAIIFLTSIILHIDPLNMADSIVDFATHHYFLAGFISLICMLICLKGYRSIGAAIERSHQKRSIIGYTRANRKRKMMQHVLEHAYFRAQQLKSHSVEKDTIKKLMFANKDVLSTKEAALERRDNLQKAVMLGNAIKHKVKIFFRDKQSNKHVETTVWHVDERHISLKGGITLPVSSIYKVEI